MEAGFEPVPAAADDWSSEPANIMLQNFVEQPGPRHNLDASACPLNFFFLMFPLVLIETFVAGTNLYAAQCIAVSPNSSWYNTCVEEMRAFLCMQIMFGIRGRPRLWMYWSEDKRFHNAIISSIMTINRFKNISRYFHCRDTANAPTRGQQGFDPLFKVRNIINTTEATFCAHFQAQRELSVDEAMVGFKGRLSFKQHMPTKPTKWGIKVWTVSDTRLGYCLGYDVYTGKGSRVDPRRPLGFEVVDELCRPHFMKGHHVYVDRFFNSVDLATHLLLHNTYLCGTILQNRKGLPPFVKLKLKTRVELRQMQRGNLVATSYRDKRTITLISTNQVIGPAFDGHPHPLIDYNRFMGGVDKLDQQQSYYPVGRAGKKWWRYLVWHLISASIYNAFITWKYSPHDYDIPNSYDLMMFTADVAEGLLNGFTSRKLPGRKATGATPVRPETIRHHVIEKISGRKKQCILCIMERKKTPKGYPVETSFHCKFCKVALCKRICFASTMKLALQSFQILNNSIIGKNLILILC